MRKYPELRKRIYETGALVFAGLTVWGVVSAEEAAQYKDTLDSLLAMAGFLLARFNTPGGVTTDRDTSWD